MALKIKVTPSVNATLQINQYKISGISADGDQWVETELGEIPIDEILAEANNAKELVLILRNLANFIEMTA